MIAGASDGISNDVSAKVQGSTLTSSHRRIGLLSSRWTPARIARADERHSNKEKSPAALEQNGSCRRMDAVCETASTRIMYDAEKSDPGAEDSW